MTPKRVCVCVCGSGDGDGGIYSPHIAKTRNSAWKESWQQLREALRRFQESKIPNPYISVLFYSVQMSFM